MSDPPNVKHVTHQKITVSKNGKLNWKGPMQHSTSSWITLTRSGETEVLTDKELNPGSKEVEEGDQLEILAMKIWWS